MSRNCWPLLEFCPCIMYMARFSVTILEFVKNFIEGSTMVIVFKVSEYHEKLSKESPESLEFTKL